MWRSCKNADSGRHIYGTLELNLQIKPRKQLKRDKPDAKEMQSDGHNTAPASTTLVLRSARAA